MNKLVWIGIAVAASAAAAGLALRALPPSRKRAMHDEVEDRPWWARMFINALIGAPVSDGVAHGVRPSWEPGAT